MELCCFSTVLHIIPVAPLDYGYGLRLRSRLSRLFLLLSDIMACDLVLRRLLVGAWNCILWAVCLGSHRPKFDVRLPWLERVPIRLELALSELSFREIDPSRFGSTGRKLTLLIVLFDAAIELLVAAPLLIEATVWSWNGLVADLGK